ncbi:unnamed protein product [Rotaria sp. Silwood2]|nr:unnamed protein product [Rotaria sp. Silwood2]CAF4241193.1 unnamed protein product [Rotaria sp. Silwood2]
MNELISLIPSILLIQMFRRLRSRNRRISPLEKVFHQMKPTTTNSKEKKKCLIAFSWWCIFIAYGISLLLVLTSIFFTIEHGIEFSDLKNQQWLISVLSSFFSSILRTESIKILSLEIFFAFFCQKSTSEDEEAKEYIDENQLVLNQDEEYLHSSVEVSTIRPNRDTFNVMCGNRGYYTDQALVHFDNNRLHTESKENNRKRRKEAGRVLIQDDDEEEDNDAIIDGADQIDDDNNDTNPVTGATTEDNDATTDSDDHVTDDNGSISSSDESLDDGYGYYNPNDKITWTEEQ